MLFKVITDKLIQWEHENSAHSVLISLSVSHFSPFLQTNIKYVILKKYYLKFNFHFDIWLRAERSGDRIPVGVEIFRTCPDRLWGPPSLLDNAHRVFLGGKERPGRDADPSPPSSAVVMKE